MREKRYRKSDSVVYRKIAQHFILVPIRHDVADLESVFTLNEVSTRIWELIDGKSTATEIAKKIFEEFEINQGEAETDVGRILEEFKEFEGIIEVK